MQIISPYAAPGIPVSLISLVERAVCEYFKVSTNSLKRKGRKEKFCLPRQLIIYLLVKHSHKITYTEIAHYFNRKDHTSVIHACKSIQNRLDTDEDFGEKVAEIYDNLGLTY